MRVVLAPRKWANAVNIVPFKPSTKTHFDRNLRSLVDSVLLILPREEPGSMESIFQTKLAASVLNVTRPIQNQGKYLYGMLVECQMNKELCTVTATLQESEYSRMGVKIQMNGSWVNSIPKEMLSRFQPFSISLDGAEFENFNGDTSRYYKLKLIYGDDKCIMMNGGAICEMSNRPQSDRSYIVSYQPSEQHQTLQRPKARLRYDGTLPSDSAEFSSREAFEAAHPEIAEGASLKSALKRKAASSVLTESTRASTVLRRSSSVTSHSDQHQQGSGLSAATAVSMDQTHGKIAQTRRVEYHPAGSVLLRRDADYITSSSRDEMEQNLNMAKFQEGADNGASNFPSGFTYNGIRYINLHEADVAELGSGRRKLQIGGIIKESTSPVPTSNGSGKFHLTIILHDPTLLKLMIKLFAGPSEMDRMPKLIAGNALFITNVTKGKRINRGSEELAQVQFNCYDQEPVTWTTVDLSTGNPTHHPRSDTANIKFRSNDPESWNYLKKLNEWRLEQEAERIIRDDQVVQIGDDMEDIIAAPVSVLGGGENPRMANDKQVLTLSTTPSERLFYFVDCVQVVEVDAGSDLITVTDWSRNDNFESFSPPTSDTPTSGFGNHTIGLKVWNGKYSDEYPAFLNELKAGDFLQLKNCRMKANWKSGLQELNSDFDDLKKLDNDDQDAKEMIERRAELLRAIEEDPNTSTQLDKNVQYAKPRSISVSTLQNTPSGGILSVQNNVDDSAHVSSELTADSSRWINKKPILTLDKIRPLHFFHLEAAQVLSVDEEQFRILLTDWTRNSRFLMLPQTKSEVPLDYFSQHCVELKLWDEQQNSHFLSSLQPGDFISVNNLRLKEMFRDGSTEGFELACGSNGGRSASNARFNLKVLETDSPEVKVLLSRRKVYFEEFTEDEELTVDEAPEVDSAQPESAVVRDNKIKSLTLQEVPKVPELPLEAMLIENSPTIAYFWQANKPFTLSIKQIINRSLNDGSIARSCARVVDYFPKNIEDFIVSFCTICQEDLKAGDSCCREDVDHETEYRYKFHLLLRDDSGADMPISVCGPDAAKFVCPIEVSQDSQASNDTYQKAYSLLSRIIPSLPVPGSSTQPDDAPTPTEHGPPFDFCVKYTDVDDGSKRKERRFYLFETSILAI